MQTAVRIAPRRASTAPLPSTLLAPPNSSSSPQLAPLSSALPSSDPPNFAAQQNAAQQILVEKLSREVRLLERSRRIVGTESASDQTLEDRLSLAPVFSSGSEAMDRALPHGGYEAGTLVEYVQTSAASGATYLALCAVRDALQTTERFCVLVDSRKQFYPPAAAAMGIDLKRLVIVRPQSLQDRLWAIDQSLRCPAIVAVVAEVEQLDDRSARRLQLAAERGGGMGLLIRGMIACRQPSWAEVQWVVRPKPRTRLASPASSISTSDGNRQIEIELRRVRGGEPGVKLELTIQSQDGSLQSQPSRRTVTNPILAQHLANPQRRGGQQTKLNSAVG